MANFHDRWRLEFTEDDLSVDNDSATWVDVTGDVRDGSLRWSSGIDAIGDEPRPGEMSFTMKGRDFEPLNSASTYYPNVKRWARFRLSLDRGAGFETEFIGYARKFQPQWPGGTSSYQEVDVVCGDGFDILAKDPLPSLDPHDADAYEAVIAADQPWGHWRLGEDEGTKLTSRLRSKQWQKRHKNATRRQKHYRIRETREEVAGVAGPAGTYKNTPTLGEDGAILGDPDTCVYFAGDGPNEYARILAEDSESISKGNVVTAEAWFKLEDPSPGTPSSCVVSGPYGGILTSFYIYVGGTSSPWDVTFAVQGSPDNLYVDADGTVTAGVWYHAALTWDGTTLIGYLNGVEVGRTVGSTTMSDGSSNADILIGARNGSPRDAYFKGWIDEVALYEKALAPDRILAHYTAGTARGFPAETAQERIERLALTEATVPWTSITVVSGGSFNVEPAMQHGQSRLEEIVRALAAEGVRAHFFFGRNGNPVVLGWEWQATGSYGTAQATFASQAGVGEVDFRALALTYDDEVFNTLTLSREGGDAVTVDNDASIAAHGASTAEPITGLSNTDDADVASLGNEFLMLYADPVWTLTSLDLVGKDDATVAQLVDRDIGDLLMFIARDENGDPTIELLTWIIGYEKRIEAGDVLSGTWRLARGWNAAEGVWLLGLDGYSELGETTVLA